MEQICLHIWLGHLKWEWESPFMAWVVPVINAWPTRLSEDRSLDSLWWTECFEYKRACCDILTSCQTQRYSWRAAVFASWVFWEHRNCSLKSRWTGRQRQQWIRNVLGAYFVHWVQSRNCDMDKQWPSWASYFYNINQQAWRMSWYFWYGRQQKKT